MTFRMDRMSCLILNADEIQLFCVLQRHSSSRVDKNDYNLVPKHAFPLQHTDAFMDAYIMSVAFQNKRWYFKPFHLLSNELKINILVSLPIPADYCRQLTTKRCRVWCQKIHMPRQQSVHSLPMANIHQSGYNAGFWISQWHTLAHIISHQHDSARIEVSIKETLLWRTSITERCKHHQMLLFVYVHVWHVPWLDKHPLSHVPIKTCPLFWIDFHIDRCTNWTTNSHGWLIDVYLCSVRNMKLCLFFAQARFKRINWSMRTCAQCVSNVNLFRRGSRLPSWHLNILELSSFSTLVYSTLWAFTYGCRHMAGVKHQPNKQAS